MGQHRTHWDSLCNMDSLGYTRFLHLCRIYSSRVIPLHLNPPYSCDRYSYIQRQDNRNRNVWQTGPICPCTPSLSRTLDRHRFHLGIQLLYRGIHVGSFHYMGSLPDNKRVVFRIALCIFVVLQKTDYHHLGKLFRSDHCIRLQ